MIIYPSSEKVKKFQQKGIDNLNFLCIISFVVCGPVAQLVRALACHARGRRFEPVLGRHIFASVAQSVEQWTENPRVAGSIPAGGTKICGFSSSGRAPPCQGGGSEFEPRNPLHFYGRLK